MRTEKEIKQQIEEYKESFTHRDMLNLLDRMIGAFDEARIEALEWVLEESEQKWLKIAMILWFFACAFYR